MRPAPPRAYNPGIPSNRRLVLSSSRDFAKSTYGVSGAPTNLLLNADGKAVFRHLGYGPGGEVAMEIEIRELLGLDPFEGVEPAKPAAAVKKH